MGNLHTNAGHIWTFSSNAFHRLIGSFINWDGFFEVPFLECLIKPVNDLPEMIVIDKLLLNILQVICENLRKKSDAIKTIVTVIFV